MPTKKQKQAVIRQLLIPIILIIAALLYQPVKGLFVSKEKPVETKADGGSLTVSYIDVGQGDATLIQKGNFSMLIDAGKNEKGQMVVSYLKKKGIKKLNILVGTHPDSDHVGGLDDVINNVQVDTVYLPEAKKHRIILSMIRFGPAGAADSFAAMGYKKTAQMPEIGKEYRFEKNVVIRFLGPLKNYKEANNNSLVVQLAYGKNRFLFMGDAEEKAEEDMIKENYDLECDVLKVGHHGSYTATGDNFLTKADPAYAVISAGKDNSYGHPHAATLAKLEDDDVQIYRTDTMGTIEAVSDGNQIHMETEKGKINE